MNKLLILIIPFFITGCTQKLEKYNVAVTGNSEELIGKMIYLKNYDHFDYLNENYILDSCKVDENGTFKFDFLITEPKLVTLSEYNVPPGSYQVFRNSPEHYTFSFCANFFALSPTIFLEPNKSYEILQWDLLNQEESIKFGDEASNIMRNYYRGHNYWKDIANEEDGTPINIEPTLAWELVENQRDSILNNINFRMESNIFKDYLKSEIYLGAINDFLNWYSYQENYEKDEMFYEQFMSEYSKDTWNVMSLEYFKLTERFISHQMNKLKDEELIYHEPDESKIECGRKYAGLNIRDKYVSNLIKLKEGSSEQSIQRCDKKSLLNTVKLMNTNNLQ